MPKFFASLVLLLLVAAAAAWLFLPREFWEDTLESPPPASVTVPAANQPVVRAPETLPSLAPDSTPTPERSADTTLDDTIVPPPTHLTASDAAVLAAMDSLNPTVVQWLLPDDQIRKWVASINLIADGKIPVKDRPLQAALPAFEVQKENDKLWMARANYRRASALVKSLTDMPPSRVAKHYAAWRPLLEQAQAELGNGKQFHERLHTAIKRVLAVQPLTGSVELKAGVMKYIYADEQMENATALEKALWRLGPSNTLRIQNYLRDLQPLL